MCGQKWVRIRKTEEKSKNKRVMERALGEKRKEERFRREEGGFYAYALVRMRMPMVFRRDLDVIQGDSRLSGVIITSPN